MTLTTKPPILPASAVVMEAVNDNGVNVLSTGGPSVPTQMVKYGNGHDNTLYNSYSGSKNCPNV